MSRVLLADDNLTVQRMVASVLRGEGMSVTVVDTGPAALDSVRRDPPDLILADFDLEGMNVAAFANRARSDTRSLRPVPILVMMSPNDSCDTDRLTAMGIQASIRKPLDSERLRQVVNQWIPSPPAGTIVLNGESPWAFPPPAENDPLLPSPQEGDRNVSSALRLNDTTAGKTTPPLADQPSPMIQVLTDIPATMSIGPTTLSGESEGVPVDPAPPVVDLSPAVALAPAETPDPILLSGQIEVSAEEVEGKAPPSEIVVLEKAAPLIPEVIDFSPVFCPILLPVPADPVDSTASATPTVDMACAVNAPSLTEEPLPACEMPPTSTPPAPQISAADLHAAVAAELAARLPEIVRAILTPEIAQAALAKVVHEVVPPTAEAEISARLPEIVRAILTPEMAQAALAKVAREVVPRIAEAEIVKEIQRLESKVS